jgi:hypothetical protein
MFDIVKALKRQRELKAKLSKLVLTIRTCTTMLYN